ncbi:unnamed protein product [Ilex paraguariensis]|uniref:Leucine-rich repeat-containing N-terminal plant-type domain-containing protein n=1 Tax=Ilex paraguariensis TaxID=185542 RepID=A0ABC8RRQ6_9AQUA
MKWVGPGFSSGAGDTNFIRCRESERQELLTFRQGLVDNRGRLSSWEREEDKNDCCKWRGVWCSNRTGHVIKLDLGGPSFGPHRSGLSDKLSPSLLELNHLESLGNLSKLHHLHLGSFRYHMKAENLDLLLHLSSLTHLEMSSVDLSGAIYWVDIIKRLPSLSVLLLRECNLFSVTSPSISFVNTSASISTLDLSYNSLDSTMFRWLFNLSSTLFELRLGANQLTGSIPDAFRHMTSLQYLQSLDLSGNMFSGKPSKLLHNLRGSNLVELRLAANQLEGPIQDAFENMTSLTNLDLSFNQLEGVIPKSLGNLCNLQSLDLSINFFSGNLPHFLHNLFGCAEDILESSFLNENQLTGPLPDIEGPIPSEGYPVAESTTQ